ncbi:MAG: hypothetical protein GY775_01765, partial [Candidatus Scalindua sp.]|nr:hypothetical protein [Candidatus Scalindua sp.]
ALQLSGVDVTLNQVITKANIDAGNLKFVPVANANGSSYDSFAFSVNDGTTDSASSYTLTVDVTAVNDAPTAAANTVTTTEDTTYTFSASDFSYSDIDSDTMASVKITTLETAGALQLSGVDVTLNQVISKADIDAGNLKFVPAANANGSGYDSFAFSVNDGTTDSASSYTLTVNVTAVEDPDSNGFYDDGASLLKFTDDDTDTKSHTKSKNSSNSNSNSRSHHKTHITNNEKVKAGKDAGHGIDEGVGTNSEKLPDGRLNALDKSSDKATDANRRHTQDSTDVDRDDMFSRNMFSKDSVSKADEAYNETFDENESKKLYDDILNSWDKSSEMTTDAIRNHAQKPTNVDSNDMYSNHNKFRNEEEHNSTFDVNESAKLYDDILNSWHKHSDMTTDAIRNHTQGLSDVDSNVSNYNKFKTEEAYNETFDVNESKKLYDDTLNSWDKHSDLTSNSFWSTTHEPTDVDSNSTHGDMFSNKMFSNDSEFRIEEVNATNDVNEGENLNSEGPVLEFIDTVEESNTDRISDQDSDPSDESGSSQDQNESTENEDVVDDDSEKKDKVPTKGFFARLRNLVVSSK